ncbi:hypothetical protein R1sor_010212 [Riccia sorocarpa]|uniref:Biogenesis of lysosome-related organelles complex 1 subunit 1 n=1 Tax=Riccia sorocarpa TaxID=122646 RepID=A0ABD3HYT7_9MARC
MGGALDASFSQMMQQHSLRNVVLANRLEKSKKEALASATEVSSLLVDSVNGAVQESFVNEKRIEMEARALASTVQRFTQTTTQWLSIFHNLDSALKEIGDFENFIKVMEYDCESLAKALNHVIHLRRTDLPK